MLKSKSGFSVIVLVLVTIFSITGCGEDKNPLTPVKDRLVGTWKLDRLVIKGTFGTIIQLPDPIRNSITVEIKNDLTYRTTIINDGGTVTEEGSYNISGATIIFTNLDQESETVQFELKNDLLALSYTAEVMGEMATITEELKKQ